MHEPTYNRLLQKADGPYCIISVAQKGPYIHKSEVPITISIDRAKLALSDNTDAGRGKEQNAIEGEEGSIDKELWTTESVVAESELCHTNDIQTHSAAAAPRTNRNIDVR